MDEMGRTILLDGTSSVSSEPGDDGRDGTMPTLRVVVFNQPIEVNIEIFRRIWNGGLG